MRATTQTIWAAAAAFLAHSVNAVECDFQKGPNPGVVVSNQQDFDTKVRDCTTVIGSIVINSNYKGSFNISRVSNITDGLQVSDIVEDGLTELILDGLKFVGSLDTKALGRAVKTLSLPNLESAKNIFIKSILPLAVSCPKLNTSDIVSLAGNITSLDFTALSNSSIDINQYGYGRNPLDMLNATFPSLKFADFLGVNGNISIISMPVLEGLGKGGREGDSTIGRIFQFSRPAMPMNISMPGLKTVSDLSIFGLNTLSLPSLQSANELDFQVAANVSDDFKYDLPALSTVDVIRLRGNFSDVSLPSLKNVTDNIYILSDIEVNCTNAEKAFNHSLEVSGAISPSGRIENQFRKTFQCSKIVEGKKPSKALAYGLGLGLGVPLFLLSPFLISFLYTVEKQRSEARRKGISWKALRAQLASEAKERKTGNLKNGPVSKV